MAVEQHIKSKREQRNAIWREMKFTRIILKASSQPADVHL